MNAQAKEMNVGNIFFGNSARRLTVVRCLIFVSVFKAFTASTELAITLLLREDDNSYPVFIRRVSNESFTGYTLFLLNPGSGLELSDDLVSMFSTV